MKNIMHIFMSFTLSMMIILMGSGKVMVHCNHTGNTRIVSYSQMCEKQCKPMASCMKTTVLKLSTMTQSTNFILNHVPSIIFLPWHIEPLFDFVSLSYLKEDVACRVIELRHGPPRDYLNKICVLLI